MDKPFNSSALAKKIGQALGLDQESELRLYKELSQLGDGEIKKALNALAGSKSVCQGSGS